MEKQVKIRCYGCMDYNKHHRDDSNFQEKQVIYESLSEAYNHYFDTRAESWSNDGHYMQAFVEDENDSINE